MTQGGAVARYDPPQKPLAAQTVTGGGYDPPDDPGAGAAMQVERPRKPFVMMTGAGGRYDLQTSQGAEQRPCRGPGSPCRRRSDRSQGTTLPARWR